MLTKLLIQDIVLIDRLSVDVAAGLNVLTGETGAGKSILLDALGLALGARGDTSLIRAGADTAQVSAIFSFRETPPPSLGPLLEEQGLQWEDDLILRRSLSRDGKSRAFLNDQPISIALLRRCGEILLEVHGQFDTQGLLNPTTHRDFLDAFGGLATLKKDVREAFSDWQIARDREQILRAAIEKAHTEADYLRACVRELADFAPREGESSVLAERRAQLQNRDKILESLRVAEDALSGDKGAAHLLTIAGKALARIVDKAPELGEILQRVDQTANDVAEVAHSLAREVHATAHGEDTLDSIEERLFALRAIARKHNAAPDDLPRLFNDLRERLSLLENQDEQAAISARAVLKTRARYAEVSAKLGEARARAAHEMTQRVMEELPPLKLERARFILENAPLEESQWGPEGRDKITFLIATNTGVAPAPLNKIASGGELARFMLALKVVLAKADPVATLVFDEVDTGIGGATASAVGERLARLASDVQVLVVTHSPQVAARGHHHLRVSKTESDGKTTTHIETLTAAQRLEEIARMLAGSATTDAARAAAKSLLDDAEKQQHTAKSNPRKNAKPDPKTAPPKTDRPKKRSKDS